MSLDLVRRLTKGTPLSGAEHDANLSALEAAAFPNSVLVVRSLDDLPAPVGGEITLPGKTVLIFGALNLGANALRLSTGTLLRGLAGASVMSSATGGVIRATNLVGSLVMRELTVIATAGPCLALTGTTAHQLNLFFMALIGASAGTVSGFDVQAFKDCFFDVAAGITVTGTTNKVFFSQCPFYGITAGNAAITLAAGLDANRIDGINNFFKGDPDSIPLRAEAGYTVGYGRVTGSMADGPTTMLDGLSHSDPNWWFERNDLILNSRVAAQSFLTTAATTPITTIGEYVPVTGGFTLTELTQRFTQNAANELVYTNSHPVLVTFSASLAVDPSNNDRIGFKATKNGVPLDYSLMVVEQGAGPGSSPRAGTVTALIELGENDRIGLAVANLDSTADIPWLSATYAVVS